MQNTNSYTGIAKFFHWGMGLLIMVLLGVGVVMADMPLSPQKLQYYAWHKWGGVSIFVLVWLRLAWRRLNAPPAPSAQMPAWQHRVAHSAHLTLYGLMVIIPLSGWLFSSAKGITTVWFGILPLPDLIPKDKEWASVLHQAHETLNVLLLLVLFAHVGAALKHHWLDKDDTLKRMLPNVFLNKE